MHPFYWWFYHIQFKIKIFMSKVPCFAKWGNLFWVLGNFVLHSILYFTIKRTYQQADFENGSFLLVSRNHFNFWQFLWNQPAVSLKPDRFWQFFWNHQAVLGGFRAKIWPKMTKSKVSIWYVLWIEGHDMWIPPTSLLSFQLICSMKISNIHLVWCCE